MKDLTVLAPQNDPFRLDTPAAHRDGAWRAIIVAAGDRGLPMDYDELERWTRIGYERGMRSRKARDDLTHRCRRWQPLEAREPEDGHERVDREAPRQDEQDKPHPAGPEAR
jgi:hypothetical protein